MDSRRNIQSELEEISSSLPFDAKMPVFDLPPGYFENFASAVLAIVQGKTAVTAADELASLSPLLASLPKTTPYTLPEQYFSSPLAQAPGAEDPVLEWMPEGKRMPFAVPEGYFDDFSSRVMQQANPRQQAKLVPLWGRKWMQYAAAAVVTGALVIGGWLYSDNKPISPAGQSEAWVKKNLRDISNQELEAFIETVDIAGNKTGNGNLRSQAEVRRLLQDVPDRELEAFLTQVPTGNENLN